MQDSSEIGQFYEGRSVLVTGATGFVGKALVEKLIRSCPDVGTVYCLVRPKNDKDVACRFNEFTKSSVFNRLRSENARALEKLRAVSGDVQKPSLGLSEEDIRVLTKEVSVVFHVAATVRFNECISLALEMNTLGTRRVVDLCKMLPNLEAFVHTSTAYSNADKQEVQEKVYEPAVDPDTLINFVKNMPEKVLNDIEPMLIGGHPNTYTYTKSMAEAIVMKEASCIPAAIVRPSIVTAAMEEPQTGWIDNTSGLTGLVMEVSRGALRSIFCDEKLIVDIIPVDFVVNTLLVAAANLYWHKSPGLTRVYNCTTGSLNPIQWGELNDYTLLAGRTVPSKYVQMYPGCTMRGNYLTHRLNQFLLQFVPAYLLDLLLKFQGLKPMMVKMCGKTIRSCKAGEYFANHQWTFAVEQMKILHTNLNSVDQKIFPVSVKSINWKEYINTYVTGIRKYILKDDLTSLNKAQTKLSRLYWGQRLFQSIAIMLFLAVILK